MEQKSHTWEADDSLDAQEINHLYTGSQGVVRNNPQLDPVLSQSNTPYTINPYPANVENMVSS